MALPAQLHASAALAPYCLKNCDADAPGQKLENLPKRGMAQAEQEGRVRCSRRVCRSKRRVAISKRIVIRSNKSVQVQKKCNEVQKKCLPPSQVQPWIFAADHGLQRSSAAASEPPGRKSGAARVALHGLGPSPSSPLKWWLNQSKSPFSQ